MSIKTVAIGDRFIFILEGMGVKIESTATYKAASSARAMGFKFMRKIAK